MSDDTRTCPHCGDKFTGGRSDKVYCTRKCKEAKRSKRKSRPAEQGAPAAKGSCHGCGEELPGRQTKWCSDKCRDRWRLHNEPGLREKVNARRRKNIRKKTEEMGGPMPMCAHCGQRKRNRSGKYCSRTSCTPTCEVPGCDNVLRTSTLCSTHYHARWRVDNAYSYQRSRSRSRAKRRLTTRDNYIEDVVRDVVMERDSWTCHLCGERIPKTTKYPHPKSASIDHIIPISLGGEHSYRNVAAAHLRCNVAKGNRAAGDQLALI